MAYFGSSWNEETSSYEYYGTKDDITKEDVMLYLKEHPDLMDEIIIVLRKEKIKKIKIKNGKKI